MIHDNLWNAFKSTGRIADYLRYRGVEVFNTTMMSQPASSDEKENTDNEADNRRSDYPREQQYR